MLRYALSALSQGALRLCVVQRQQWLDQYGEYGVAVVVGPLPFTSGTRASLQSAMGSRPRRANLESCGENSTAQHGRKALL